MLSTQYRLRLEAICKDIASGTEVSIDDMIWAQKLSKANTSARGMLNKARRMSTNPNESFLNIFCLCINVSHCVCNFDINPLLS